MDCAEAYIGTPHKQARGLTQPGRKKTVSGWKLNSSLPVSFTDPPEPQKRRGAL